MNEVFIMSIARTPIGSLGGVLSSIPATQLGATAIKAAMERAKISPDQVNEVYIGNVLSANLGQAPAQQASILAGIPTNTPCTTVNKVCASGMKAIMLGAESTFYLLLMILQLEFHYHMEKPWSSRLPA